MTPPCVTPLPLYRPRDPQASDLWRLIDEHFETFQQVYDAKTKRIVNSEYQKAMDDVRSDLAGMGFAVPVL